MGAQETGAKAQGRCGKRRPRGDWLHLVQARVLEAPHRASGRWVRLSAREVRAFARLGMSTPLFPDRVSRTPRPSVHICQTWSMDQQDPPRRWPSSSAGSAAQRSRRLVAQTSSLAKAACQVQPKPESCVCAQLSARSLLALGWSRRVLPKAEGAALAAGADVAHHWHHCLPSLATSQPIPHPEASDCDSNLHWKGRLRRGGGR